MFMIKVFFRRTIAFLPVIILLACHRPFSVQNSQYQQYGIDQKEASDSAVVRYYLPYKQKIEAEMSRVLGVAEHELTKPATPETLIGNFYADAVLAQGLKLDPAIQFTLPTTKGGIRNPLPKGNLTVGSIFELMPFENELVVVKLTGAGVKKLIDFVVSSKGQPVSGLRMKIKDGLAYDVTIAGKPFDINQSYNVLTSDYLANSGDESKVFSNPIERKNLNKTVRAALIDYITEETKKGKTINTRLDGRIIVE